MTEFGLYVEVNENKCEGFVPLRDLDDDYYEFDEKNFACAGGAATASTVSAMRSMCRWHVPTSIASSWTTNWCDPRTWIDPRTGYTLYI